MKKKFDGQANKGGIYKITNIKNEKFYIGSTNNFKKRANQHQSRLNAGKHHNKRLLASWNKHGSENFMFEVLEVVEGITYKRRKIEQQYINKFWGHPNFLNHKKKVTKTQGPWSSTPEETRLKMRMAKLGKPRGPHSEETKKKIGKANSKKKRTEKEKNHLRKVMSGRIRSLETKQKISETMKEKGLKPPSWLGKKHSIKTKLKLSKKVYQIDSDNKLIAEFVSITKASQTTKIDVSSIVACCKGRRKTAGGFKWKYAIDLGSSTHKCC